MYKNFMNVNYQIIQEIKADFLNLAHCWLYNLPQTYFLVQECLWNQYTCYYLSKTKRLCIKVIQGFINQFILYQLLISRGNNRRKFICNLQTNTKFFLEQLLQQPPSKINRIESMERLQVYGQNRTFNFYIQYRYDGQDRFKNGKFIDKWILDKQQFDFQMKNQQIVGNSLKLSQLSVIITRIQSK